MHRRAVLTGEKAVRYDTSGCWQVQSAFEGWAPKPPSPALAKHLRAAVWGVIAALAFVLAELLS